ncbi:MAG: Integrase core domain protein [Pelotomaculum sp. PtaB.Bin104]|nr:MAG: Integrase core domain protein [Pelotomaculum sp. PtaB.Bin104]
MTSYKEILRLHSLGINNSRIASGCGYSRTTVINVLQRAKDQGLSWQTVAEMSDKELSQRLFPSESAKPEYKMPDYEYIHREMAKSGVTLTLLWLEYCDQCRESGQVPYKSTQFNKYYADYVQSTKATMHIHRKPGEIMEVDWAGQTARIIDINTGEIIPAYVFVAALPYSGYAYVEAFLSQNQESWITAHVNAYRFFGGVTRILVPDNLKTGVEKVRKGETVINKTYQEMAEHYGIAVIPARVRAPKDKPTVEGSVGIISTWILAALRNQQFLSLRELNAAIREKLMVFLEKPFQKKDGSRATLFAEEKPFLLPLPSKPFELATWKIATVQYNYHISVDTQNYSVPFEYIKQKVDVRITRNVIEVFFQGNRICSHPRLYGRSNQYCTLEAHMPPEHQKYVAWNGERFRSWAAKIGEHTSAVISFFLGSHKVEQQGYKACMALLKLADKYSVQRLESACAKALSYTVQPSLKGIQAILKSGQDKIPKETPAHSSSEFGLTPGADYYSRRDGKC